MKDYNNIKYYSSQGIISSPYIYSKLFDQLPSTASEIVNVIHGLFLHVYWANHYGVTLNAQQKEHAQARHIRNILKLIVDMDSSPLTNSRPYNKRFFGTCRDHALFLVSVLRHKGIPARCRCGCAKYFTPMQYEDHWIAEYWDKNKKQWMRVDPQLDDLQKKKLNISFDTLNLPEEEFISGGRAWKLCREGKENPDDFGIFDFRGLEFVRGNLIKDLASLNKIELLPWDFWGLIDKDENELTKDDYELLDEVTNLIENDSEEIFTVYNNYSELKVPASIRSYTSEGVKDVSIG